MPVAKGTPDRKCAGCGEMFAPKGKRQCFCNKNCYRAARKAGTTVPRAAHRRCNWCGAAYEPNLRRPPSERYCGDVCNAKAQQAVHRAKERPLVTTHHLAASMMLDHAPDCPAEVASYLRAVTDDQFWDMWLLLIVEQFGDGKRSALADALRVVKERVSPKRPIQVAGERCA